MISFSFNIPVLMATGQSQLEHPPQRCSGVSRAYNAAITHQHRLDRRPGCLDHPHCRSIVEFLHRHCFLCRMEKNSWGTITPTSVVTGPMGTLGKPRGPGFPHPGVRFRYVPPLLDCGSREHELELTHVWWHVDFFHHLLCVVRAENLCAARGPGQARNLIWPFVGWSRYCCCMDTPPLSILMMLAQ